MTLLGTYDTSTALESRNSWACNYAALALKNGKFLNLSPTDSNRADIKTRTDHLTQVY